MYCGSQGEERPQAAVITFFGGARIDLSAIISNK